MNIIFCPNCQEIYKDSGLAEILYTNICEKYVILNYIPTYCVKDSWIHSALKFLEKKRLILSTEISFNSIAVKPLGHIQRCNDTHEFCIDKTHFLNVFDNYENFP